MTTARRHEHTSGSAQHLLGLSVVLGCALALGIALAANIRVTAAMPMRSPGIYAAVGARLAPQEISTTTFTPTATPSPTATSAPTATTAPTATIAPTATSAATATAVTTSTAIAATATSGNGSGIAPASDNGNFFAGVVLLATGGLLLLLLVGGLAAYLLLMRGRSRDGRASGEPTGYDGYDQYDQRPPGAGYDDPTTPYGGSREYGDRYEPDDFRDRPRRPY